MKKVLAVAIAVILNLSIALGFTITLKIKGMELDVSAPVGSFVNLDSLIYSNPNWVVEQGDVDIKDNSFVMPSSDVVISLDSLVVRFDSNGGAGWMNNQSFERGQSQPLDENKFIPPDGKEFSGWATSPTGSVAYLDKATYPMGNESITLYAVWRAKNYTLTFNANGGKGTTSTQQFTYGETKPLKSMAECGFSPQTGYIFAGWASEKNSGVEYKDGADYSIGVEDETLYAVWSLETSTVTFVDNNVNDVIMTQEFTYGVPSPLKLNPRSKTGHEFAGWAETAGGSVVYANGASYKIGLQDVILYAKWKTKKYDVIFDSNGGSGNMPNQEFEYGKEEKLMENRFVPPTGHRHIGWSTTPNGAKVYEPEDLYSVDTQNPTDITLYALWAPEEYEVTFEANGGTGSMATQKFIYDEKQNLSQVGFEAPAGKGFRGWSTSPNGTVSCFDKASYTIGAGDVTLYAIWHTIGDVDLDGTVDAKDATQILRYDSGKTNVLDTYGTWYLADTFKEEDGSTNINGDKWDAWAILLYCNLKIDSLPHVCSKKTEEMVIEADVHYWVMACKCVSWKLDEETHTSNDSGICTGCGATLYTLAFNANTGTGSMDSMVLAYGKSIDLPYNKFTAPAGKGFRGWSTSPGGDVAYFNHANYPVGVGDVTLYAMWNTIGDVNLDGRVNALDATQILRYVNEKPNVIVTSGTLGLADTFLDGVVNATDATYILKYANNKVDSLPHICSLVDAHWNTSANGHKWYVECNCGGYEGMIDSHESNGSGYCAVCGAPIAN